MGGLGLTPVGVGFGRKVGLEVCVVVVVIVIKGDYSSSCIPLSSCTML